jgi:hypothetical protein
MSARRGALKAGARRHGHYSGPSGASGAHPSKFDVGRFVAWDGEGTTDEGDRRTPRKTHYVYLANSAGRDIHDPRGEGLSTRECLSFLCDEAARIGDDATHVCFGLSYDANEFLRDVPRRDIRRIWKGGRTRILNRFTVTYRARKSFWVRDGRTGSSLTLWDPFGFYQSSFVQAVVDNLGPDDPRLPLIRDGKARRAEFRVADLPFIRNYTAAELSALVDLCGRLREAFRGANLKLKRWDGAGAAAAALLEREAVKSHMAACPSPVHEAALYAYAGGRIETTRYGFWDSTIYHKDIRSAYPRALVECPSLRHGRWKRTRKGPDTPFALAKVRWNFGRLGDKWSVLPFPFRSSSHAIYFPRAGTTWVWRPELDAALRHPDLARRVEILDGWSFHEDNPEDRPFRWVPGVYAERERLKRLPPPHDAPQKALKLGMNSTYGKTVQRVGGRSAKDGKPAQPPPYHQIEWGGYVTSQTRARLFDAAVAAGGSLVTLATDGVYATREIPGLDERDALGAWEATVHERMLIAQSGVYWYVDARARNDGCDECGGPVTAGPLGSVSCDDTTCGFSTLTSHFRGFDPECLNPDVILAAWRKKETVVPAYSSRFVTMGRACLSDETFGKWLTWVEEPRELIVCATGKRLDRVDPARWTRNLGPHKGLMPTDPADPFERVSTPYSLSWGEGLGELAAGAQEEASLR